MSSPARRSRIDGIPAACAGDRDDNARVMSRLSSAVRVSLAINCAVVLTAAPPHSQPTPIAGVVKNVTATAVVVRGAQELPLAAGQQILEGDTIKTGSDGRVGLTLKDGTRLSLGANTELRIDAFLYAPAERGVGLTLKLLRGVATYISGRIAQLAPGAVKIETPTSVIGVRGTHLLIAVEQP